MPDAIPNAPNKVVALYSPSTGMVACPILQAVGKGSRAVPHLFDTQDWVLTPEPHLQRLEAPWSEWQKLAKMDANQRVQRYMAHVAKKQAQESNAEIAAKWENS